MWLQLCASHTALSLIWIPLPRNPSANTFVGRCVCVCVCMWTWMTRTSHTAHGAWAFMLIWRTIIIIIWFLLLHGISLPHHDVPAINMRNARPYIHTYKRHAPCAMRVCVCVWNEYAQMAIIRRDQLFLYLFESVQLAFLLSLHSTFGSYVVLRWILLRNFVFAVKFKHM